MARILIIDDERQIIQFLRAVLTKYDYHHDFISKPEFLLPKLEQDPYDLILLDVYMPGIDGITVLKQLKAHPIYNSIPVIMLTGNTDEQLLSKCFDYGSIDFIYKPIKGIVLNARIKSALATSQYIQQISEQKKKLQDSLKELHRTQTQLVESEKMAALGGLVAGVAHEINTPLGIGVTAASYLTLKVQEYKAQYHNKTLTRKDFEVFLDSAVTSSEMILSNLSRAAHLITSFKQIAVDQSSEERRIFKIKPYLDDILQSVAPRISHTIIVSCPDNLEVCSYPGAFSKIITNLLMNSLQHGFADQDKGTITIHISQDNSDILLQYHDNGQGMTAEHLKKIFNPFFTTKRGKGATGLGMHLVYRLVTQTLGGHIDSHSILKEGITFKIWMTKLKQIFK